MEHNFDIEQAMLHGVDVAILLKNFQYWISKNKANGRHFYEGRTWTYNSIKAFAKLFPYWTERQIIRILKTMEEKKLIISGNHNNSAYDRTKWYAFFDESIYLNGEIDLTKQSNGNTQKVRPIPDIKPYIKPDNKPREENISHDSAFASSTPPQKTSDQNLDSVIQPALEKLNSESGASYRSENRETRKHFQALIKKGYGLEDFILVIEKKALEWKNDKKMKRYLRPCTLFGGKFEQYLEEPWCDEEKKPKPPEKYDSEKHMKFTRWESLSKKTQYAFGDREYYENGRNGIAGQYGKTVFWTEDPEDLNRTEASLRKKIRPEDDFGVGENGEIIG